MNCNSSTPEDLKTLLCFRLFYASKNLGDHRGRGVRPNPWGKDTEGVNGYKRSSVVKCPENVHGRIKGPVGGPDTRDPSVPNFEIVPRRASDEQSITRN